VTARHTGISVVIPAYNCARYLPAAIDSALRQSLPPVDVIVVDDGSTDGTGHAAAGFGTQVACLRQENQGPGAAKNAGIAVASGDLLAFLDGDDLWTAGKLAAQAAALAARPDLDMVFGHVEEFYSEDLPAPLRERLKLRPGAMPGIVPGTLLIRRGAFDCVGPFHPEARMGDFMEWYLRATDARLSQLMLDDVLLRRRVHADNMGARERDRRPEYARILKAALDRRRAAALRPPQPGGPGGA
jgi:glycosyltransferase involved in cell wall biosynthesis